MGTLFSFSRLRFLVATALLWASLESSGAEVAINFNEKVSGELRAGSWDYLRLDASECNGYMHVQLWNVERLSSQNQTTKQKADPMLMIRPDVRPFATYDKPTNWAWSPNTEKDETGYRLLRAYHHVIVNQSEYCEECGETCPDSCVNSNMPPSIYYIGIFNVDIFMAYKLEYELKATCHPIEIPCPAPNRGGQPCSGFGKCVEGQCVCLPGHGDVGCDKPLEVMQYGKAINETLEVGHWMYYELTVEEDVSSLLVEIRRTAGDPVLFVKHISHGYVKGGVPSVSDYTQFADTEGFRSRLNYHYRLMKDVMPGKYYVAVFNNDVYLQEEARYSVQAITQLNSIGGLCPMNCSYPNGVCTPVYSADSVDIEIDNTLGGKGSSIQAPVTAPSKSNMQCKCSKGFAGHMCEGKLETLVLDQAYRGDLAPADWIYFMLELPAGEKGYVESGLKLSLKKAGGYPVLLSKKTDIPMLLDNDFIFPTGHELDAESQFLVESKDLSPGRYYMGMFNMDYYTHSLCSFELHVSLSEVDIMMFNPTMSIVLGVLSSMFLCLFMSVCKRMFYRTTGGRFGPNGIRGGVVIDNVPHGVALNDRNNAAHGLTAEQINAFPQVSYVEGMFEKEDAQCSVCLCDYEAGEMMRKLPACEHSFHINCIDRWLANNTTCPLCRMELDPNNPNREAEDGDGNRNTDETTGQGWPSGGDGPGQGGAGATAFGGASGDSEGTNGGAGAPAGDQTNQPQSAEDDVEQGQQSGGAEGAGISSSLPGFQSLSSWMRRNSLLRGTQTEAGSSSSAPPEATQAANPPPANPPATPPSATPRATSASAESPPSADAMYAEDMEVSGGSTGASPQGGSSSIGELGSRSPTYGEVRLAMELSTGLHTLHNQAPLSTNAVMSSPSGSREGSRPSSSRGRGSGSSNSSGTQGQESPQNCGTQPLPTVADTTVTVL